jgi:hypothetical protein
MENRTCGKVDGAPWDSWGNLNKVDVCLGKLVGDFCFHRQFRHTGQKKDFFSSDCVIQNPVKKHPALLARNVCCRIWKPSTELKSERSPCSSRSFCLAKRTQKTTQKSLDGVAMWHLESVKVKKVVRKTGSKKFVGSGSRLRFGRKSLRGERRL